MLSIGELVTKPDVSLADVTSHCDGLAHTELTHQTTSLNKAQQIALWDLAEGSQALTLDYLVPEDASELEPFPFWGKNSLPAFKRFQKVFYFDKSRTICGYNKQSIMRFTGPGYFQVHMNPKAESEIQIDYTMHPTEHPSGWPKIKPNTAIPARFIYGGTKDNLRYVSRDVVIGRACKQGEKPMPNWFILCRETPSEY